MEILVKLQFRNIIRIYIDLHNKPKYLQIAAELCVVSYFLQLAKIATRRNLQYGMVCLRLSLFILIICKITVHME